MARTGDWSQVLRKLTEIPLGSRPSLGPVTLTMLPLMVIWCAQ